MADNGWKIMLLIGINQKDFKFENSNDEEKKQVEQYYSHWTIKYARTLGNKRFMRNIIASIVFVLDLITFVVLCVIHYQFNDKNKFDQYYVVLLFCQMLCLFILGVCVILFSFYSVSKFTDFIYIKHEIIGMCIIGCIIAILIAIWTKFDYHNLLVKETKDLNEVDPLSTIFWFFIVSLMSFILSTLTLSWVIYKYNPDLITVSIDWRYYLEHCLYLTRMCARSLRSRYRSDNSDISNNNNNNNANVTVTNANKTATQGEKRIVSFDLSPSKSVDQSEYKLQFPTNSQQQHPQYMHGQEEQQGEQVEQGAQGQHQQAHVSQGSVGQSHHVPDTTGPNLDSSGPGQVSTTTDASVNCSATNSTSRNNNVNVNCKDYLTRTLSDIRIPSTRSTSAIGNYDNGNRLKSLSTTCAVVTSPDGTPVTPNTSCSALSIASAGAGDNNTSIGNCNPDDGHKSSTISRSNSSKTKSNLGDSRSRSRLRSRSMSLPPSRSASKSRSKSPSRSRSRSKSRASLTLPNNGRKMSLRDLIGHEAGYRLFMRYLVDHMAMECLLFFTELLQFKKLKIFDRLDQVHARDPAGDGSEPDPDRSTRSLNDSAKNISRPSLSCTIVSNSMSDIFGSSIFNTNNDYDGSVTGGESGNGSKKRSVAAKMTTNREEKDDEKRQQNNYKDHVTGQLQQERTENMHMSSAVDLKHFRHATKRITRRNSKSGHGQFRNISIPSNIPRSLIMSDKYNVFEKIDMLRDRYINDYASLQINIAYQHRCDLDSQIDNLQQQYKQLQSLMSISVTVDNDVKDDHDHDDHHHDDGIEAAIDDETLLKLYTVFDQALDEMFNLMTTLFHRYRHTEVCSTNTNSFGLLSCICAVFVFSCRRDSNSTGIYSICNLFMTLIKVYTLIFLIY